jgi:hypothetical protein
MSNATKQEIEKWIDSAVLSAGLAVQRLPQDVAADIERRTRAEFVVGNPRAWWMSLRWRGEQFDSTTHNLSDVLPDKAGKCWFIPETESRSLTVYSVELTQLPALLRACPYFEYYVVGNDFGWLLSESDHNVFIRCRAESTTDR